MRVLDESKPPWSLLLLTHLVAWFDSLYFLSGDASLPLAFGAPPRVFLGTRPR